MAEPFALPYTTSPEALGLCKLQEAMGSDATCSGSLESSGSAKSTSQSVSMTQMAAMGFASKTSMWYFFLL